MLPSGRYSAEGPRYRHPHSGKWVDAILLPESLAAELGRELTASIEEMRL
jgi:hypothetical protein